MEGMKKTVALDSLCCDLDLKFSQIQLGSRGDEVAAASTAGSGEDGQDDTADTAPEEKTKADLIRKISMDSVQKDIQKQMEESYSISFKQFTTVIQMKSKYLNRLKI